MTTMQKTQIDSAEGRKFLRKVFTTETSWREDWYLRADAPDWEVKFSRTIKGEIGEPDQDIEVFTDAKIGHSGQTGSAVQSFDDAQPVIVPAPRYVTLSGDAVKTAAKILADGGRLWTEASEGSTSSSKLGLAFLSLHARLKGYPTQFEIGHGAIYADGRCICSGSVSG